MCGLVPNLTNARSKQFSLLWRCPIIFRRSILAVYAAGVTLENFRQPVFQEHIILRFGKEEGCFQCVFSPSNLKDAWQVDISQLEAPCVKLTK